MKKYIIGSVLIAAIVITLFFMLSKETIVLTYFGDFSGDENSFQNAGYRAGVMALDEIKKEDLNHKYKIEIVDFTLFDTEEELQIRFKKLRTSIIIGPFLSSSLDVYGEFLMNSGYVVFVPSSTLDNITGKDDSVYRIINSTSNQAHQTAELFSYLGYENIYNMYDTNNQQYTYELITDIASDPLSEAIDFTNYEYISYEEDFTPLILSQYEAIFICSSESRSAELINTIRGQGITQPIFLSSWAYGGNLLMDIDSDVEDVYLFTNNGDIDYETNYEVFVNNYILLYNIQPSSSSIYCYEIMYLINHVIGEEDFDKGEFDMQMHALLTYKGVFFNYDSLGNGDYFTDMGLVKVDNQRFEYLHDWNIE